MMRVCLEADLFLRDAESPFAQAHVSTEEVTPEAPSWLYGQE